MEDKLTICIKTFNRPPCLRKVLESVRKHQADLPVVIVDDSGPAFKKRNANIVAEFSSGAIPLKINYIQKPFDIGAAAGRNVLFRQATTPFVFYCDDDSLLVPQSRIKILARVLEDNPDGVDMIGCKLPGRGVPFQKTLKFVHRKQQPEFVIHRRNVPKQVLIHDTNHGVKVFQTDYLNMCFVARREKLVANPLPASVKIGAHAIWMGMISFNGKLKMGWSPFAIVREQPARKYPGYGQYRGRVRAIHRRRLLEVVDGKRILK